MRVRAASLKGRDAPYRQPVGNLSVDPSDPFDTLIEDGDSLEGLQRGLQSQSADGCIEAHGASRSITSRAGYSLRDKSGSMVPTSGAKATWVSNCG